MAMIKKCGVLALILSVILCGCGATDTIVDTSSDAQIADQTAQIEDIQPDTQEVDQITQMEDTEVETESETESVISEYDVIPEEFAYSLLVSINPLVELYFDVNDVVIGVAYLNDDAVEAYQELELIGTTSDEGLDLLVSTAIDKGYLVDDGTVNIELARIGSSEDVVDNSVLTDAFVTVNTTIQTQETETPINASVEIAVAEEVAEETGVTAPVICTDCNGTGNNCSECGGTGDVRCKRCNGGIESCGTCGGSAIITCHGCHGAGTVGDLSETCSYCGGSGRMSCDACGGQGTFTCSWCGGALHHICPDCWGEGTCSSCGGDGYM